MTELITGLFDTTGFEPRGKSGPGWTPLLVWLHIASDLFIWLAYVSIPLVLLYFTRRRDLPFPGLFVLFALFILACGTTHLLDALMFEYPVYRFAGLMKFVTAVVSWVTVIALVPTVPRVMQSLAEVQLTAAGTKAHRPLRRPGRFERGWDYLAGFLVALLAIVVRAAINPLVGSDPVFVVALLAVVYVSWQCGFGPGILCLVMTGIGYMYFIVPPRGTILLIGVSQQLPIALWFFCGVACAALGESQRLAQQRARRALATAMTRQEALESEVARRRVVEAALRQREQDLVAAQRETASALARLNAFLDNAPLGIAFFDSELRCERINPFLAPEDRSVAEFASRPAEEVLPDFPPGLLDAYRADAPAERKPVTTLVRRADRGPSSERVWQVTAFPVRGPDGFAFGAGIVAEDVTTRLKAEEDLRRSERNLADFFENANIGLHWVGPDGVIQRANRAELEMLGYARDEYVGRPIAEFHAEPERMKDMLARLARGEQLDNYPARLRRKDGTILDVLISASVLWENGRFVHTRSFTRDVTELKRTLDALRESEARFRSMADSVPALIWLSEVDGQRTYFNKGWLEFTGRTADEEGTDWENDIHPEDHDRYLETYAAATAGQQSFELEYRLRRHDGVYRWVLARGTPRFLPGGAFAGLVGLCVDVTDRREAAESVRRSAERFRSLTEAVTQMVWTADTTGAVRFVNRRWEQYTGFSPESLGDRDWGRELIHPDDVARVEENWQHAVAAQAAGFTTEFRLRRAGDRAYRWILSVAVPLRDSAGRVVEWVGTLTDIDDQKRQTETLERMVRERTAELESANATLTEEIETRKAAEDQVREVAFKLEQSNAELEKFASIASHDLQEPLRKIQAFGDRLRERCREELPEPGQEYLDRMLVAAGRMRRLIDDLLALSRVTTQQRPFQRVDLGKLVREVVSDLDVRISDAKGTVRVGELPVIDADPTQMRQLFQNLIANAVKFQQPGVPPVVETNSELVSLPGEDDSEEPALACRITVRDNGIGFDEKYLDRIFEAFQRLHGRNEYEGTGIGLAICRKIVERHAGTITAHSREGSGATFVVTLPLSHPHSPEDTGAHVQSGQTDHDPDGG